MDDEQVVGQLDPDHFQHQPPVVGPDPLQAFVKVALAGDPLRLAGVVPCRDDMRLADSLLRATA